MQDYDTTLKLLLKKSGRRIMSELIGAPIVNWLDVELPKVQNLRPDLLGETADGKLAHLELQSTNDHEMALRIADYKLGIYRKVGRFPRQVVLYVGEPEMRMETALSDEDFTFRYRLVDIRSLDADHLLASDGLGDNVIALLARLRDHKEVVRRIISRIMGLPSLERQDAVEELLILTGLRRPLARVVQQEVQKMPITIDFKDHPIFGPMFDEAEDRGLREGRHEGRQEGDLVIVRRLIEKRFGPLPQWAEQRLAQYSWKELEDLSVRVLDASTIEELVK